MMLDENIARRFMALTLSHIGRPYPFKMDFVWESDADARPPSAHHPIFHGSFDWHSCVHGWWQLLRLARAFPATAEAQQVRERADAAFVPEKVAGEIAYFARTYGGGASRPYGWAWLLKLHGEGARADAELGVGWGVALEPLARDLAGRLAAYFQKMTYPIRVGAHFNSSFAMRHAHQWALDHDPDFAEQIGRRARDWFGGDVDAQAWEPGGDEFLSSTLTEALLMRRILPPQIFAAWFDAFLPRAAQCQPATLFTPAHVSDRSDGKIAHLDGLNLSRAWAWRGIACGLPADHGVQPVAADAADRHLAAALPHVAGDYMGEHWLASFALLALDPAEHG